MIITLAITALAGFGYAVLGEYLAHNPSIPANSPLQLLKAVLGVVKDEKSE